MDFGENMKNPFLFDDPAPPADVGESTVNPFLMGGAFDYSEASYTGINPFSDQIDDSNAAAAGLFGDTMSYPTDMNPFGIVTSDVSQFGESMPQTQEDFFGTPVSQVNEVSEDFFGSPTMPPAISEAAQPSPIRPAVSQVAYHPPRPPAVSEVARHSPVPPAVPQVPHHSPVPPARPPAPSSPIVDLMSDVPVDTPTAPGRPPPPRRPPPPSKETKDLLQTVIGAMEATTDTLHEKLNKTRTPCPSPGSGAANSRSPTPDIHVTSPKRDSDAFSAIFGQTIDMSDHEMDDTKAAANASPSPASATSDEFDLFGDAQPLKLITNQDILSLFNKPQKKQSPHFDLLSDDLLASSVPAKHIAAEETASDLLSGASYDEKKQMDAISNEEESRAQDLLTPSDKESVSSETPAATESCLSTDIQSEPAPVEESVSPEQISEKTDSEPTVIEAAAQDVNEANKIVVESEAHDSSSANEEKLEAMEVFGSPEPAPPTVNSEQPNSPEVSSHLSTPVKPSQPEPETDLGSFGDQSKTEVVDAFGVSDAPTAIVDAFGVSDAPTAIVDAFGVSDAPTAIVDAFSVSDAPTAIVDAFGVSDAPTAIVDAFGVSDAPTAIVDAFGVSDAPTAIVDAFGVSDAPTAIVNAFGVSDVPSSTSESKGDVMDVFGNSTPFGETDAFALPDAFGEPSKPDSGSVLFGETSSSFSNSTPTSDSFFGAAQTAPSAASLFGDISEPVPPPSPAASLFGEVSHPAPPASPACSLFDDIPQPVPPASPAAELFNNTSSTGSSGFDLFGSETAPVPVPSGADSTGAALFGSSAPAPNVGMSLFGAGDEPSLDIFAESDGNTMVNPFAPPSTTSTAALTIGAAPTSASGVKVATDEEFDAFSARFDSATGEEGDELHVDPFASAARAPSPWGETTGSGGAASEGFGFGDSAPFDAFLAMNEPPPPPQSTPRRTARQSSADSDEGPMSVVIKPAGLEASGASPRGLSPVPVLAPPPAVTSTAFTDSSPRFNPFDRGPDDVGVAAIDATVRPGELERTDSQETPPTPLFEEDQSQPLEAYPRTQLPAPIFEMHLRQPNKKKITGQSLSRLKDGHGGLTNRFWKKVFVKLTDGAPCLQLFNSKEDKDPFQELPLQACYSVSDIGAQQFDQFGKIFTVKVQYIFYKERPGVRPGQVSKAERLPPRISKFAHHAIAGDYEHVKEFASDVRKLGMPVEHAPQISQLLKLGTQNYEDLKVFASLVEEQLFTLAVLRDRALNYKSEEVQLTAVDEIYVEQDHKMVVHRMIARVRIFFLGFLSGMPDVDLGINDMRKQGREVVGRHDIIPVITEEWIRLEAVEFHCCVNKEEFEKTQHIKFKPPDACYIELMRFRVRPPKNRELPLQVKTKVTIQGRRVDIFSEILVPGFSGRKLGQVPCEDVVVRFPLPECWIYLFRVEKHFRYGSVKSAHRRTGKVKGIERLMGTVETAESALMEVTSGQAKYEHQHRAIVWRMARLPKEGQGAYTTHTFTCHMNLSAYDQIPESLDKYCYLEFTMPATTVSHCVMRSVSVTSEEPPEKYVRYLSRHEYRIEMEFSSGSGPADYIAATMKDPELQQKEEAARKQQEQQQQQQQATKDSSSEDSS
ncbi:LOW QUALITY PROTEIN: protein stoned-B [Procambarus clarkii]|uniref:LOW QUALITY PROTEIN: protein stoned-B n=1 Tax=Procambarus clarkii TaxID=6728 RepID=UPI00374214AE